MVYGMPSKELDAYDFEIALMIKDNWSTEIYSLTYELPYEEYAQFLADKVEKFRGSEWDVGEKCLTECIEDYCYDNNGKWIRELRGETLYKVKVVLELDVESADKLGTVIGNVKELFYDKSVVDYGCDAIKDVRVVNAIGKEVNE